MDLADILSAIQQHGKLAYSFMLTWAATNSLLVPLLAGYAAHLGALDWGTLVLICWAGGFLGDLLRFWVGRRWGHAIVKHIPMLNTRIDTIIRLVRAHYVWMILIHRYPQGIRNVAGFAFGMTKLPWLHFLALNFVSAGLWALIVVTAGYSFGHLSEETVGQAASGASLLVLALFLGLAWFLSRKLDEAIERQ
jgi:membrane protein DedA with SNARE-associated domain